ncbi:MULTISPECIES: hypothetical protein [unclassified Paenibacillus]|uniref:hypothetical protein n=1 Tax=unclassified Paenibacillus TaxID=185978 RepID=UPI001AE30157|nr:MULTISPECIES: hypothetical protein [unclassified Paenibacillus]MBP1156423.1 aryl-alcohol dehydrogenase-like predicted oxidoreductase [Paenibacillus sp. PvP091]MBP1168191.1 aryl-alcohol dehydrogenase-like predicted oxidoreductase [Paenibacillus sp. PvR098]MBP2439219.1 aryl-alcohol dehydrogenase-like predicted oxidoreductase [Paenibacillus sp. PvP052]
MGYNRSGRTGLEVSEVGLGCMSLGGSSDGKVSPRREEQIQPARGGAHGIVHSCSCRRWMKTIKGD